MLKEPQIRRSPLPTLVWICETRSWFDALKRLFRPPYPLLSRNVSRSSDYLAPPTCLRSSPPLSAVSRLLFAFPPSFWSLLMLIALCSPFPACPCADRTLIKTSNLLKICPTVNFVVCCQSPLLKLQIFSANTGRLPLKMEHFGGLIFSVKIVLEMNKSRATAKLIASLFCPSLRTWIYLQSYIRPR